MKNFIELSERVKSLNQKNSEPWPSYLQLIWVYEELGELSSEILKLSKIHGRFSDRKMPFDKSKIEEEIGDVLYGLVSLSLNLDVNLLDCLDKSINKFQSRSKNELT